MLSADDRASMLGEPVAPKSVFEFLSARDKERLQSLGQQDSRSKETLMAAGPAPAPEVLRVPTIDARVAQSALKGFMPYGDDPAKQARYKAFLQHFAMPLDANKPFKPSLHSGKGISEQNAELEAFANAAMIFKPMSGMMANRFTSSSQTALLDIKAPEAGLHMPKPVSDSQKILAQNEEEQKRKKQQEREAADPRRAAVREGNFGPLTRTVQPWYPARLLCKRFNVADPHPEGAPHDSSSSSFGFGRPPASQPEGEVLNKNAMDNMMQERKVNNSGDGFLGGISFTSGASSAAATPPPETVLAEDDDTQGQDVLSYEKPSMDIFKAIFASDDEDEEDEQLDQEAETTLDKQAPVLDDPSKLPDTSVFDSKRAEPAVSLTIEDLSSFKPTFVSRTERSTVKEDSKKKDKEKKKKKKTTAVLSFDLEDGDEEMSRDRSDSNSKKRKGDSKAKEPQPRKKERKEPNKTGDKGAEDEEDDWVEKEVTPIVADKTGRSLEQSSAPRKAGRVTASQLF